MEENKDAKTAEGSCGKGGCGMHCGCCACKAIKGLILLLIGGVVGYWIGHCCHARRMCRMESAPAQAESAAMPEAPAKKAK